MQAVAAVIDRAAAREQLALARIEGLTAFTRYQEDETLGRIRVIARKALGLFA